MTALRGAVSGQIRGRDTFASPAAQKRQRRSIARVIPTRTPTTTCGVSQPSSRAPIRTGPSASDVPFSSRRIASACDSLPSPEQKCY